MKKTVLLGIGAVLCMATTTQAAKSVRTFEVKYDFDIKYEEKQYGVQLWNPMPLQNSYQKVRKVSFDGNYDHAELNSNNAYNAEALYARWTKTDHPKKMHITMLIETKERSVSVEKIAKASEQNLPMPPSVKQYLASTAHIPTDGIIKGLAVRITQGKTDRFEKVKAIYYWATSHTFRDSKVIGCGTGDVNKMVTQKQVEDAYEHGYYGGKCTDLSSLFTALVRAVGIPAREVFGIRLGKSHFSKALGKSDEQGLATISTWQHCRAEYYIPGAGWIPTDPADITKLMLVEGLKYNDPKVKTLTERYLHSWEMNWMGFNTGRDFVLSPKPEQFPINMFGYPYAEAEGDVLNYYNPKEFGFTITSQEIK